MRSVVELDLERTLVAKRGAEAQSAGPVVALDRADDVAGHFWIAEAILDHLVQRRRNGPQRVADVPRFVLVSFHVPSGVQVERRVVHIHDAQWQGRCRGRRHHLGPAAADDRNLRPLLDQVCRVIVEASGPCQTPPEASP